MNYEFNKFVNTHNVSTNAIRFRAIERLEEIKKDVQAKKHAIDDFNNENDPDNRVDESLFDEGDFMSGFIFDLVILGGLSAVFPLQTTLFEAFNVASAFACFEAASLLVKDNEDLKKAELFEYPEGRRPAVFGCESDLEFKNFHLTPKRSMDKNRGREKQRMYEILKMVKDLEKEGLSCFEIASHENIYDSLKQVSKDIDKMGAVSRNMDGYSYAMA